MVRTTRRQSFAKQAAEQSEAALAGPGVEETAPEPVDPAHEAVFVLVSRILLEAGSEPTAVAADGIATIVILPAQEWSDAVMDVWRLRFREGRQGEDGIADRFWHRPYWVYWAPKRETPR